MATQIHALERFKKDPHDRIPYTFNWAPWMQPGDSIQSATFSITGHDNLMTVYVSYYNQPVLNTATAYIDGGTVGNTYYVTCKITTSDGLIAERSISLQIVNL